MNTTSTSTRRNDLDWLRVLAVLLLVPFHSALIFVMAPDSIMYIKDTVNSEFLDRMAGFIHQFHMPLLFIVTGASTYLALGFRSGGQYLRERVQRLLHQGGKTLRYLSEAAFPFYILHLPLATLVGYFIIQLDTVIAVKYLLIVGLTTLLTFGAYELVKSVSILRFLFGMKLRSGLNATVPKSGGVVVLNRSGSTSK